MSPRLAGCYGWRKVLLLSLMMSIAGLALAKTKNTKGGDYNLTGIVHPELINAPADPTMRFPVMNAGGSVFSITYGWLDISNSMIRYTVMQPASKTNHSFQVSRLAISQVRLSRQYLTFRISKTMKMLIYLPQDRWGSVHTGPGMGAAANRESLGTTSIYKTLLNYDRVLALVMPPAPPPAPVVVQPAAPVSPRPAAPSVVADTHNKGALRGKPRRAARSIRSR